MLRLKYLFVQLWLTFQLKVSFIKYVYYFEEKLFVAEVTPLKGYRADVFCARDMLNKSTGCIRLFCNAFVLIFLHFVCICLNFSAKVKDLESRETLLC